MESGVEGCRDVYAGGEGVTHRTIRSKMCLAGVWGPAPGEAGRLWDTAPPVVSLHLAAGSTP